MVGVGGTLKKELTIILIHENIGYDNRKNRRKKKQIHKQT